MPADFFFQVLGKFDEIEEVRTGIEINKYVHITVGPGLNSCKRAEYSDPTDFIPYGKIGL